MRDFSSVLVMFVVEERGNIHEGPGYHSHTADVEELEVEELAEARVEFYAHVEVIYDRPYHCQSTSQTL